MEVERELVQQGSGWYSNDRTARAGRSKGRELISTPTVMKNMSGNGFPSDKTKNIVCR